MFLEASTHNIRRQVAIVGTALIVAPMAIVLAAGWGVLHRIQQVTEIEVARPVRADLTPLTQNLVDVCRSYHRAGIERLKRGEKILDAAGEVHLDGTQMSLWHAKNEISGELKTVQVPLMMVGSASLLQVNDFDQTAPVVDEIAKVEGTPATIFQRISKQGDMLRVCSSLKSETGTREIGTYVTADGQDSAAARALKDVLTGKTYFGNETHAGVTYLTAYQPLKNTLGNVVGMLYTALPEDEIRIEISHLLPSSTNVDHPEPFIFQATGENRGTALLMGDRSLEERNLWNETDPSGRPYVQGLCSRALKLSAGEFADYKYLKVTRPAGIPRAIVARFAYVAELEWVVGFTQPDGAIVAGTPPMLALTSWAMWLLFGAGVAGTGLAVRLWIKFSDDLVEKLILLLADLKKDAKQLTKAAGELSKEAEHTIANKQTVNLPQSTAEILRNARRMTDEIHLALQHIDASDESIVGMIAAIDQIAFAANLLMANAAIQSSNSSAGNESIVNVADDLRFLADRIRSAARTTKAEIEQSRAELEKGKRDVLRLVKELHLDEQPSVHPPDETAAAALRRQAETLLRLAQGIGRTVEAITADLGTGQN